MVTAWWFSKKLGVEKNIYNSSYPEP